MISSLTINGLTMGTASANYTIKEAQGFGTAEVEVVRHERPGFHGSVVPRAYFRARVMRLRVGVKSTTISDYASKRRALLKALDLPRGGLTTMTFTTTDNLQLQCDVQLAGSVEAPLLGGEVTMGEMWIPLIAPNPLFLSQTETWKDIMFSMGTGIVNNTGDALIFPKLEMYGAVSGTIILKNQTTGRTLSFSGLSLGSSEYATIDMENETVNKNDSSNLYSYVDSDDFWWLNKGSNTINISATIGGSGYRKVTIKYRAGYLGV